MPITIQVDLDGALRLSDGMGELPLALAVEVEKSMAISTGVAEAEVKALTPRKTGRLFSAWQAQVRGVGFDTVGVVNNRVDYAGFVEEGTGPHDIVARGKALMIPMTMGGFGGGRLSGRARAGQQVAFFKKVRHPGAFGRHMARLGLETAKPEIFREFRRAVARAIEIALHRTS